MRKIYIKSLLVLLLLLWTAFIIYGSLASFNELPEVNWWSSIPYFDKMAHFIFYFVETALILLVFDPKRWQAKSLVVIGIVAFSGIIEVMQQLFFFRSGDIADFTANAVGALAGVLCYVIVKKMIGLHHN